MEKETGGIGSCAPGVRKPFSQPIRRCGTICLWTQAKERSMKTHNRWTIAIAGVFLQIVLGAVYAWSVFRIPLHDQFGWTISQITLTFTISIFMLGFAAFVGGLWMNRVGPRMVALTAGTLYGVGVFLASFSAHKLWWL